MSEAIAAAARTAGVPLEVRPDRHFYCSRAEFGVHAAGRKALRMEYFYREMRRRHRVLLDPTGEPEGGQWNFDHDNRKAWSGKPPEPMDSRVRHDHSALWGAIVGANVKSFGEPSAGQFAWPLNRPQALRQLDHFVGNVLPHFGDFQDAMSRRSWRLFHSLLSFALNSKMLCWLRDKNNSWQVSVTVCSRQAVVVLLQVLLKLVTWLLLTLRWLLIIMPWLNNRQLWQLVQNKTNMIVISDDDSPGFYQIYLDGRKHPEDPNPAWRGHNVAHWEGDTLVVDRVGFHEGVWLDQDSHSHSEKLHIVDRYTRPDMGHIEIVSVVEDPGVLSRPFTMKRVADLAPDQEILEFICPENNQDVEHMVGK